MQELLQRHLAAYGDADWAAYKADLASDATYEEIATGKRASGADACVEAVKSWKTAFPDAKATIKKFFVAGDVGITELEWEGTHSGPFETPFGAIPATNQKGTLPAVLISRVENDKIVETRHYFDVMTLMRQMGVTAMPRPTAPAEAQPAPMH